MRQSVATRPVDGDAGTHGLIYAQALTACFAGPVFNLLVTLCLLYTSDAADE